jgi:hypothetical protein
MRRSPAADEIGKVFTDRESRKVAGSSVRCPQLYAMFYWMRRPSGRRRTMIPETMVF